MESDDEPRAATFEKVRQWAIDAEAEHAFGDGVAAKLWKHSQYRNLLEQITLAAQTFAADKKLTIEQFEREPLRQATDLVSLIKWCLVGTDPPPDKPGLNFWSHDRFPLHRIQKRNIPSIDRSGLEQAVGQYLELPFRASVIDRLLVDAMVAMELYGFGDEILNEEPSSFFPAQSPLKQRHVLIRYLRNLAIEVALLLGLALAFAYGGSVGFIGVGWTTGIVAALVGLFLLSAAWGAIWLPLAWREQNQARRKVRSLLGSMISLYAELKSEGPISARRIRDLAAESAATGVVWPTPLFALLDDVLSRSGRF